MRSYRGGAACDEALPAECRVNGTALQEPTPRIEATRATASFAGPWQSHLASQEDLPNPHQAHTALRGGAPVSSGAPPQQHQPHGTSCVSASTSAMTPSTLAVTPTHGALEATYPIHLPQEPTPCLTSFVLSLLPMPRMVSHLTELSTGGSCRRGRSRIDSEPAARSRRQRATKAPRSKYNTDVLPPVPAVEMQLEAVNSCSYSDGAAAPGPESSAEDHSSEVGSATAATAAADDGSGRGASNARGAGPRVAEEWGPGGAAIRTNSSMYVERGSPASLPLGPAPPQTPGNTGACGVFLSCPLSEAGSDGEEHGRAAGAAHSGVVVANSRMAPPVLQDARDPPLLDSRPAKAPRSTGLHEPVQEGVPHIHPLSAGSLNVGSRCAVATGARCRARSVSPSPTGRRTAASALPPHAHHAQRDTAAIPGTAAPTTRAAPSAGCAEAALPPISRPCGRERANYNVGVGPAWKCALARGHSDATACAAAASPSLPSAGIGAAAVGSGRDHLVLLRGDPHSGSCAPDRAAHASHSDVLGQPLLPTPPIVPMRDQADRSTMHESLRLSPKRQPRPPRKARGRATMAEMFQQLTPMGDVPCSAPWKWQEAVVGSMVSAETSSFDTAPLADRRPPPPGSPLNMLKEYVEYQLDTLGTHNVDILDGLVLQQGVSARIVGGAVACMRPAYSAALFGRREGVAACGMAAGRSGGCAVQGRRWCSLHGTGGRICRTRSSSSFAGLRLRMRRGCTRTRRRRWGGSCRACATSCTPTARRRCGMAMAGCCRHALRWRRGRASTCGSGAIPTASISSPACRRASPPPPPPGSDSVSHTIPLPQSEQRLVVCAVNAWIPCMQVITHIAACLARLHDSGYVHRDLKPANIMWLPRENRWTVIDFGCTARAGESAPMRLSLAYAAPEVVAAAHESAPSIRAAASMDSWSLGVVAVELLADSTMFDVWCSKRQVRALLLRPPSSRQASHFLPAALVWPRPTCNARGASRRTLLSVVPCHTRHTLEERLRREPQTTRRAVP